MIKHKLTALLIATSLGFLAVGCSTQSGQSVKTEPVGTKPSPVASATKKPVQVPAYQSEESAKTLPPTLSPEMFTGEVRAAYEVAKRIPETIAQLPCFCRCDRSMKHKSLHSCYVDDHAVRCGICINSAMKAYKLQLEKKMTPTQIREELIAEYKNH